MAAAFASLAPLRVLWKLSKQEAPDVAALEELNLTSNTKVPARNRCTNGAGTIHLFTLTLVMLLYEETLWMLI